jgi:hypothetical protein
MLLKSQELGLISRALLLIHKIRRYSTTLLFYQVAVSRQLPREVTL